MEIFLQAGLGATLTLSEGGKIMTAIDDILKRHGVEARGNSEKEFLSAIFESFRGRTDYDRQPNEGWTLGKKEMEDIVERFRTAPARNETIKKHICG